MFGLIDNSVPPKKNIADDATNTRNHPADKNSKPKFKSKEIGKEEPVTFISKSYECEFEAKNKSEKNLPVEICQASHAKPIINADLARELKESHANYIIRNSRTKKSIAKLALDLVEKWEYTDYRSIVNILKSLPCGLDLDDLSPKNIWLHRNTKKIHLNLKALEIGNNPNSVATIANNDSNSISVNPWIKNRYLSFDELNLCSRRFSPNKPSYHFLPHGGLNVLLSTDKEPDNGYSGDISIRINLHEVIKANGRVYRDIGAVDQTAVMIALPFGKKIPFEVVSAS